MRFDNGLFQITPDFVRAPDEVSKKIAQPGELVIAGYATTFDKGLDNAMLFNHDQNRPIGRIYKSKVDDRGLFITGVIDKSEPEIQEKIKSGTLSKFSIRGRIMDSHEHWDETANKSTTSIDELKLLEVSVVSVPAVAEADINSWYVQRNAFGDSIPPTQEGGGDNMSDENKNSNMNEDSGNLNEDEVVTGAEETIENDDLVEAIESSQLELLLDLDERVTSLVSRTEEVIQAVNLDAIMKKLDEIQSALAKVLSAVEKMPYPAPAEKSADGSTDDNADGDDSTAGAASSSSNDSASEMKAAVETLTQELKELKETVLVRGEQTNETPTKSARETLIESEVYRNADPSEKLRLLWDIKENQEGGEK